MVSASWVIRTTAVTGLAAAASWAAVSVPAALATTASAPAAREAIRAAAVNPAPLVRDSRSGSGGQQGKRGLAAPAMSAPMLKANAARQLTAHKFVKMLRDNLSADAKCTSKACQAGLPEAKSLARDQQAQIRDYYCGPATVSEMLAQMGKQVSQKKAARELHTTLSGTDWSDDAGYPVPDVLNAHQNKNNYVAVALPWAPTTSQVKTFETDLVTDVNHHGGVPLAGNAYEVAGGPHLAGNPVNQTIFHWFDIRGYSDYGAVTDYEDSVHGASSIGWSAAVPAYSAESTREIVDILGARGYDW